MANTNNDPELYRQLSAPFDTAEEANTALVAFYADVRAARIKHRMPDALVIVAVNVRYQDDATQVGRAISHCHNGNQSEAEGLAAYAYGQLAAEHREEINKAIAGKSTTRKQPPA